MSNTSKVFGQGACPTPFLDASQFPATGGCKLSEFFDASKPSDFLSIWDIATDKRLSVIDGRFCSALLGPTCCLPCPQTEWLYPDNFDTITYSADWINVAGMVCSMFLLISFAFLPVGKTHRHYLSICLAIATVMMQVSIWTRSPLLP